MLRCLAVYAIYELSSWHTTLLSSQVLFRFRCWWSVWNLRKGEDRVNYRRSTVMLAVHMLDTFSRLGPCPVCVTVKWLDIVQHCGTCATVLFKPDAVGYSSCQARYQMQEHCCDRPHDTRCPPADLCRLSSARSAPFCLQKPLNVLRCLCWPLSAAASTMLPRHFFLSAPARCSMISFTPRVAKASVESSTDAEKAASVLYSYTAGCCLDMLSTLSMYVAPPQGDNRRSSMNSTWDSISSDPAV